MAFHIFICHTNGNLKLSWYSYYSNKNSKFCKSSEKEHPKPRSQHSPSLRDSTSKFRNRTRKKLKPIKKTSSSPFPSRIITEKQENKSLRKLTYCLKCKQNQSIFGHHKREFCRRQHQCKDHDQEGQKPCFQGLEFDSRTWFLIFGVSFLHPSLWGVLTKEAFQLCMTWSLGILRLHSASMGLCHSTELEGERVQQEFRLASLPNSSLVGWREGGRAWGVGF